MFGFLHIEQVFPNLSLREEHAHLQLSELTMHRFFDRVLVRIPGSAARARRNAPVGLAVLTAAALPAGRPAANATKVQRLAHLLADRSGYDDSAKAIVPGPLVGEFAEQYPNVELELWSAPGGPVDFVAGAADRRRLAAAYDAARSEAGAIDLAWEGGGDLRTAEVNKTLTVGSRRFWLRGALVSAVEGELVCERGYLDGHLPRLRSWLVCSELSAHHQPSVRFAGWQIRALFSGM